MAGWQAPWNGEMKIYLGFSMQIDRDVFIYKEMEHTKEDETLLFYPC